jgi:hypothetical protein
MMNSLEFESNFEEIIYAKLCGHTPQACASPFKLAWTSRASGNLTYNANQDDITHLLTFLNGALGIISSNTQKVPTANDFKKDTHQFECDKCGSNHNQVIVEDSKGQDSMMHAPADKPASKYPTKK